MDTKPSGIYEILNLANGKRYIGSAKSFARRYKEHWKSLRAGTHENPRLQHAWTKYGTGSFAFRTILTCAPTKQMLLFYEQQLLDKVKPEYNICPTAGSAAGRTYPAAYGLAISARLIGKKLGPQSDEHKRRRLEKLRGRKRPPFSPEWIAKLSAALKGRPHSPEHIEAAAAARRGKPRGPLSEHTRAAISKSTKGRPWSVERRARWVAQQEAA